MTLPLFDLPEIETPVGRVRARAAGRRLTRGQRAAAMIGRPDTLEGAARERARIARQAPIKAKRAGVNAIAKHMRATAPIVTGRLRRSMTARLLNRETRLRITFKTPYANWVDINSKYNKRYVRRGAIGAPRFGNQAAQGFWRFEWIRRIDRIRTTGHLFTQFRVIPVERE